MSEQAQKLGSLIEAISKLFPESSLITLLVRNPEQAERNCVLSDEQDLDKAINALRAIGRSGSFKLVHQPTVKDAVHKAITN